MQEITWTVTDFVAVFNQTLEYAYPSVIIEGELSNVRVSRGRWVYFDLKDESSSVKCFGTVYQLPGPVEDGMTVRIVAAPRLHQLYGFSLNISQMLPVGEGSIKKASDLLFKKLEAEGLFDPERKRSLPYAPERIALITSAESAAYKDFIKILGSRWSSMQVQLFDVQVQGDQAVVDIVEALSRVAQLDPLPEVVVMTRGGGSTDDLAVFGTEPVVRAIAACRIPTLVAIGHEIDTSLAELAADMRASTPSNAAELLVPDKKAVGDELVRITSNMSHQLTGLWKAEQQHLVRSSDNLTKLLGTVLDSAQRDIKQMNSLLQVLNPATVLERGYAIVRDTSGRIVRKKASAEKSSSLSLQFQDGTLEIRKK